MSGDGIKYDAGKRQWSLLPISPTEEVIEVLQFGAKKYAVDNWQKVPEAQTRYIDAAYRHLAAYVKGERRDAESGKSHLAHAVCCLLFRIWFDQKAPAKQEDIGECISAKDEAMLRELLAHTSTEQIAKWLYSLHRPQEEHSITLLDGIKISLTNGGRELLDSVLAKRILLAEEQKDLLEMFQRMPKKHLLDLCASLKADDSDYLLSSSLTIRTVSSRSILIPALRAAISRGYLTKEDAKRRLGHDL